MRKNAGTWPDSAARQEARPATALARRDFMAGAAVSAASLTAAGVPALLWSTARSREASELVQRPASAAVGAPDPGLILRDDAPMRAETPLHLLDGAVTPVDVHFVTGAPPDTAPVQAAWTLAIEGRVRRPVTLDPAAVPHAFPVVSQPLLLECGENGCTAFGPRAGTGFVHGGVGNALWTGVRLRHVLEAAGIVPGALGVVAESRGGAIGPVLPLAKALDDDTLLAFGMGGQALPPLHGAPLRLVVPGWPEHYSRKWVVRLRLVAEAGVAAPLSVKSVVTAPCDGATVLRHVEARGAAWAGDHRIARVEISTDFGATWRNAALDRGAGPHGWTRWHSRVAFAGTGYAEIWARAVDETGAAQPLLPDVASGRNNAMQRVWVAVV